MYVEKNKKPRKKTTFEQLKNPEARKKKPRLTPTGNPKCNQKLFGRT